MQTAITTDADGKVISSLDTVPTATISFGRTVTFADTFGAKEECSIFLQVPLVDGNDEKSTAAQIEAAAATAKAFVYQQLGLEVEVQENGVVTAPPQIGQPKAAKGGGTRKPASGGGSKASGGTKRAAQLTDEQKADLWVALANAEVEDKGSYLSITADGETVYDNRESKRSPNGPDFKWKDAGHALWLSDAPDWFTNPGEGV